MISEFDGKDAFDKIFPYPGIVKAVFVFRGQQGEVFHKGTGKKNGDQSRRFRIALQLHGFPGDRHAAFHLRAYGDEIHIFAQGIPNKTVQFVVAIVTDVLSQKTRTDTQFDSVFQAASLSLPLC